MLTVKKAAHILILSITQRTESSAKISALALRNQNKFLQLKTRQLVRAITFVRFTYGQAQDQHQAVMHLDPTSSCLNCSTFTTTSNCSARAAARWRRRPPTNPLHGARLRVGHQVPQGKLVSRGEQLERPESRGTRAKVGQKDDSGSRGESEAISIAVPQDKPPEFVAHEPECCDLLQARA